MTDTERENIDENEIWGLQYIGEIHLHILKRRWKDAIETHKVMAGAFGKLKLMI